MPTGGCHPAVWLDLPLVGPPALRMALRSSRLGPDGMNEGEAGARVIRVVVVDDEALVRSGFELILGASEDIEVVATASGGEAVQTVRRERPDVVLLDIRMHGMDGLSVIREARRKSNQLPIIIITGFSTEASAIEAINLGVSGYLTKPFRLPRIVSAAARALGEPVPAEV